MLVEMATKHYNILGERTPVQLSFYDNGNGCMVVARHKTLNRTMSTNIGDDMDRKITLYFENMIRNNKQNHHNHHHNHHNNHHHNHHNHNQIITIENPDVYGEDSIIIGLLCTMPHHA